MNPGTVLVTGARGFLGRHVTHQLRDEGWVVYSAVRSERRDDLDVEMNLEDQRFVTRLDELPKLDAVVHLAAKVDFSISDISALFQTNIVSTAILAEFARRRSARFVFASSALVAGAKAIRIERCSSPNADTPYTRSKLIAEELVNASGVSAAILRIGGIFGLDGPSHLGLNRALHSVLDGCLPEVVGSATSLRNYIYVKDVAMTIADVLRRNITGTHLVAGGDVLTISEMLESLCDVFLPGSVPLHREGHAGFDQLIEPSIELLSARSFKAALLDIRSGIGP